MSLGGHVTFIETTWSGQTNRATGAGTCLMANLTLLSSQLAREGEKEREVSGVAVSLDTWLGRGSWTILIGCRSSEPWVLIGCISWYALRNWVTIHKITLDWLIFHEGSDSIGCKFGVFLNLFLTELVFQCLVTVARNQRNLWVSNFSTTCFSNQVSAGPQLQF